MHRMLVVLAVVAAVNLIAPAASFSYRTNSNFKQFSGQSARQLQVLAGENPDGTLLVSVDYQWPPVRIAVQSLFDCNLTYPEGGLKPGSYLSVESSLFARFPIFRSMVQAPSHRFSHSVAEMFEPSADQTHTSDGPDIRSESLDRRSIVAGEKSEDQARLRTQKSCPSLSIRAPVLLNLSYFGSHSPKPRDKMTWVYSIQQGSVPLSSITLLFEDPVNFFSLSSYISRNISVPWNFQSTSNIISGSITYKVKGSELSSTFILSQVVLKTQACPGFVHTNYRKGGWIYYSYNSMISTINGPQAHGLQLLAANAEPYVLGNRPVFSFENVKPPVLIEFKYVGNYSVAWGEELIWEYKVILHFWLQHALMHSPAMSCSCAPLFAE
jgi:hypothetical protein